MSLFRFNISLLTLLFTANLLASEAIDFPTKFKLNKVKSFHKHAGPQNHITGVDSNRNFTDQDEDGVFDLMDSDIDGDGVFNYMDIAPQNKRKQGKDKDKDGIPDFLDFKIKNILQEQMSSDSAKFQEILFKKKGILIFNGDEPFTNTEVKRIVELFLFKELSALPTYGNLQVIFKQPFHSMGYLAKYRDAHGAIILYDNQDHRDSSLHQELSIVHETFHAFSFESEELWNQFMSLSGWSEDGDNLIYKGQSFSPTFFKTKAYLAKELIQGPYFPNDYSKMGPEEMFAECATASLMASRGALLKIKYPMFDKYRSSAMHRFFLNSFAGFTK